MKPRLALAIVLMLLGFFAFQGYAAVARDPRVATKTPREEPTALKTVKIPPPEDSSFTPVPMPTPTRSRYSRYPPQTVSPTPSPSPSPVVTVTPTPELPPPAETGKYNLAIFIGVVILVLGVTGYLLYVLSQRENRDF